MMVYVDNVCNECGFAWSSEAFNRKCPECGSTDISQKTVMGNRKSKKDNMMPYIYWLKIIKKKILMKKL